jgi:hypothetical protein
MLMEERRAKTQNTRDTGPLFHELAQSGKRQRPILPAPSARDVFEDIFPSFSPRGLPALQKQFPR